MRRPRLADHVQVRLHRAGTAARAILHDTRGRRRAQIGLREWRILSCCDGTRDLEGIVLAAALRGARTRLAELEIFLARLEAAELLAEGPPPPPSEPAPASGRRWARPLPGFALECDGRGTCCRFYDSVSFRPDELLRARALAPEVLDCGAHPQDGFTPERGSARLPWRAASVATVDGGCAFLESDGRCRIHRRGGDAAKPLGCRLFPLFFVDDGRELRASPRPECACVIASGRLIAPEGPPLEVDPGTHLAVLGDLAELSRAAYLAWADALEPTSDDVAAWLRARARELGAPERGDEANLFAALIAQSLAEGGFRSEQDIGARVERWVLRALELAPAAPRPEESFYLRAVVHGHLWAFDAPSLGEALRRRALILELSRRLPAAYEVPIDDAGATSEPLALVEALARKTGFIGAAG